MVESMGSTPDRLQKALDRFAAAHEQDPDHESTTYHRTLDEYVRKLSAMLQPPVEPSEALLLAANSQHIRRWEKPRKDWPEGLSGYKTWRTNLNRFHAAVAEETMLKAGYSAEQDAALIERVKDFLLKKTLARPPLPEPLKGKSHFNSHTSFALANSFMSADPEMHLLEDCICLTFLKLQFAEFTDKVQDQEKMVVIVKKTWAKMTPLGRTVVAEKLLPSLSPDLLKIVKKALA